jgi:uncharacterized protein
MHRLIAASCLIAACAVPLAAQEPPTNITVPMIITTGEAIVRRAPDQAWITAAVESRAKNPRDAQKQTAATMAAVQQRLIAAGVPKDHLRTLGYTVQQEVDYVNGRRVPREYVARNAIEVRLDDVSTTGDILDAAVQAGATSVGGVRFDLRDRAGAEREALRMAVADARARADAAAAGAGRSVDRVLRIDDSRSPVPPPRPMMMARQAADAQADVPVVEPGVIEIQSQVTLTVSIK